MRLRYAVVFPKKRDKIIKENFAKQEFSNPQCRTTVTFSYTKYLISSASMFG